MATSQTTLRLGRRDHGRAVTAEEFAFAEFEEPWRYERIGGRLDVMAPAGEEHIETSEPWRDHLGAYRLSHPAVVRRVASEAWIRIDEDRDRVADVAVYLVGSNQVTTIPNRVPDLAFEIVTLGSRDQRRDYVDKREEYARLGVREYVIIDRAKSQVTVLTLADGKYSERVLRRDEIYSSPLLPGLAISLAEVLPPKQTEAND